MEGTRSSNSPVPPSSRFFTRASRRREGRSEGLRMVGLAFSLSSSMVPAAPEVYPRAVEVCDGGEGQNDVALFCPAFHGSMDSAGM